MSSELERGFRLPKGWFATLAGGVLGTGAIGFLGAMVVMQYIDTYSTDGLESLGTMIVGTLVSAFLGAAIGAALMLKAFHHDRAWASGFTFAVLGVIVLTIISTLGQLIVPQPLHDSVGAVGLALLTPVTAAIVTRMLLTGGGHDG